MTTKWICFTAGLLALSGQALAADLRLPLKAPPQMIFYGGQGAYCGAGPGGEATKIGAAGVANAAVYEAGGLMNLNCGYTWAVGTDRWVAIQANYAYSNQDARVVGVNGSLVDVEKHQSGDLKVMYGAPLSVLSGIFSNAAAGFPALPPVPPGAINSTMHPYVSAGARVSRDTATIDGLVDQRKTKVKPLLGLGAIYQTNTATTINTFVDWTFGSGRFLIQPGAEVKEGSAFRFGVVVNYAMFN